MRRSAVTSITVVLALTLLAAGCTSESGPATTSGDPTTTGAGEGSAVESTAQATTTTAAPATSAAPLSSTTTTAQPATAQSPADCTTAETQYCEDLRSLARITLLLASASRNEEYISCTVDVLVQSELADMFRERDGNLQSFFDQDGWPFEPLLWLSGSRPLLAQCPDDTIACEPSEWVDAIATTSEAEITVCVDDLTDAVRLVFVDAEDGTVVARPACVLRTPIRWRADGPDGESYVLDISSVEPPSLTTVRADGTETSVTAVREYWPEITRSLRSNCELEPAEALG